jgi:hypothetical protein
MNSRGKYRKARQSDSFAVPDLILERIDQYSYGRGGHQQSRRRPYCWQYVSLGAEWLIRWQCITESLHVVTMGRR